MVLKPFDFGILIPALGIAAASFFFIYSSAGSQSIIRVKGENGVWIYPKDAVEILHVEGPLGETVVEVREGRTRVLSSPCANQTCVSAGTIHAQGQWIACLPNRVLVSIENDKKNNAEADVDVTVW